MKTSLNIILNYVLIGVFHVIFVQGCADINLITFLQEVVLWIIPFFHAHPFVTVLSIIVLFEVNSNHF